MKRHVAAVPLPENSAVLEYQKFIDEIIIPEIRDHLLNFDYSYSQWYNHLNSNQQRDIDNMVEEDGPCKYDMFCKREVQDASDGYPKNRAIAGPQAYDKFVLGPVCWKLEDIFSKYLEGYCGGKNWSEMETQLSNYYNEGYDTIIQGDGSGFDRTQSHELKYFDRKVYELVADKVHHVDPEIFLNKATSRYRTIRGTIFYNGKMHLCKAKVDATVTSGSPDTTLMNTARMAIYNRFMAYKAGVQVKIKAKGDDFAVFTLGLGDADKMKLQYEKYWAKKGESINEEKGLGLVLKFLTVGDYSTYDFCSTHLICDYRLSHFKIVRQWNRIIDLGQYSMKAMRYSQSEKNQYIEDLCVSYESWIANMPFYQQYVKALRAKYLGKRSKISINGKPKKTLPHDGHELIDTKYLVKNTVYGRDFDYGSHTRQSTLTMSDFQVEMFFLEKYGLVFSEQPWLIF